MEKNLKLRNIPKLLEEYEKFASANGLYYHDAVLIEIIKNLNNRILELEHEAFTKDLEYGKNKSSADGDSKRISESETK